MKSSDSTRSWPMGVMDCWILHLFFYIFSGLFANVWFQKTFLSSFVAVLVRGLPLPCIAGLLFSTSVPSFASLERPKGSKQYKNRRFFNILQRCQNRHKSLQHDQEANLGIQMNLIESLEGVLGASRALPSFPKGPWRARGRQSGPLERSRSSIQRSWNGPGHHLRQGEGNRKLRVAFWGSRGC